MVFQPLQPKSHSEPVQWTLPLRKFVKSSIFKEKWFFSDKTNTKMIFFLEAKIANSYCHFRCQITPFPEHILQKMSIFWWELWILSGLQVTYQISYVVIFLFLHAILEDGIILKKLTPLGPNYPPFLAAFQQKLKKFASQKIIYWILKSFIQNEWLLWTWI